MTTGNLAYCNKYFKLYFTAEKVKSYQQM